MINSKRLLEEFMELVRIDSHSLEERKMADTLTKKLQEIGLEVYEDKAGEVYGSDTGNIIARLAGKKEGDAIMFLAHMDRVEPGNGVNPKIENGIIKSDGTTILASDDCAGIAAILEALRSLKDNNAAYPDIEVVFTIAEEKGLLGAKVLDFKELKSKLAFVFDSTGEIGTMIVRAPAQDEIKIVIEGKASHAGIAPEEGINAIQVAAKAISQLKIGRIDQETTNNIGVIQGGRATNIVPDYVELQGETRSLNEEKVALETKKIAAAFSEQAAAVGAKIDFSAERVYSSFEIKRDEEVSQRAIAAIEKLGLVPEMLAMGGGSDANILNAQGIRCLNLSIGSKKVHTMDEEIAMSDLEKVTKLCYSLMSI